jgi:AcrR family transcriptional regulator
VSGTPGRPLSAELSEQLLSVSVDILAEEGWGRLNSDRVAARARAGKAGIYRRWPTMSALARHAVSRFSLVDRPEDTGSVRGDVAALVERLRLPLSHEECAVASLLGAARHDEELRAGLDAALVQPLALAVTSIGDCATTRGEPVPEARLALLRSVVEAFYWQRYTAAGDGAISAERLDRLVDDVLMPLVEPARESAAV